MLSFWSSNPEAVGQLSIEQIVSSAGSGALKDESECSMELRAYLSQVETSRIASYIDHCLSAAFSHSGLVLQDLVNELGRRLDYTVLNGRYQGVSNAVGFDGLWRSPEGHAIVAEVKTTDAYRISLDTLAGYRNKLLSANEISPQSSILVLVGRQDTGELEAQIRGSRHAWEIRVISVEALIKLVLIKENSEGPETGLKIRSLLTPVEYTRLDRMVDVMFTTVTDVDAPPEDEGAEGDDPSKTDLRSLSNTKYAWEFTDSGLLQAKREKIIAALSAREATHLVRRTRALYWNSSHDVRVACAMSKRYEGKNQKPYWYAYHPPWDDFLDAGGRSFFVLGCMDLEKAYAIPHEEIARLLPLLNTTTRESGTYWHIHLSERHGEIELALPKSGKAFPLTPFEFSI